MDQILLNQLARDESKSNSSYKDSLGFWTIGYGHHDDSIESGMFWSDDECLNGLQDDINTHNQELLEALPWTANVDAPRLRVLQNMCFNLGIKGLLGFKHTLSLVESGQYELAAQNMLLSLWAKQVGDRAIRRSQQMATGIDQ